MLRRPVQQMLSGLVGVHRGSFRVLRVRLRGSEFQTSTQTTHSFGARLKRDPVVSLANAQPLPCCERASGSQISCSLVQNFR
jgi:hypothetical protein